VGGSGCVLDWGPVGGRDGVAAAGVCCHG
jgi:hypothetical protein